MAAMPQCHTKAYGGGKRGGGRKPSPQNALGQIATVTYQTLFLSLNIEKHISLSGGFCFRAPTRCPIWGGRGGDCCNALQWSVLRRHPASHGAILVCHLRCDRNGAAPTLQQGFYHLDRPRLSGAPCIDEAGSDPWLLTGFSVRTTPREARVTPSTPNRGLKTRLSGSWAPEVARNRLSTLRLDPNRVLSGAGPAKMGGSEHRLHDSSGAERSQGLSGALCGPTRHYSGTPSRDSDWLQHRSAGVWRN